MIWFAVVLLRLRSIPVVLVPSLAAGAVGAWALSKDAFSKSLQPLAAKEAVAGDFGLFVLLLCLVLLAVGYAINMGDARGIVPIRAQRRIGGGRGGPPGAARGLHLGGLLDRGLSGTS